MALEIKYNENELVILSDTHGYLEDIDLVLAATADQDIDMWLHAGDFGDDARYMQEHTDIPVYAVRGNNDRVQPLEPREQLIPLEDTYIYMTHGHEVSYYNRIQKLIELGTDMGARLIVSGHSHHHGEVRARDAVFEILVVFLWLVIAPVVPLPSLPTIMDSLM